MERKPMDVLALLMDHSMSRQPVTLSVDDIDLLLDEFAETSLMLAEAAAALRSLRKEESGEGDWLS